MLTTTLSFSLDWASSDYGEFNNVDVIELSSAWCTALLSNKLIIGLNSTGRSGLLVQFKYLSNCVQQIANSEKNYSPYWRSII